MKTAKDPRHQRRMRIVTELFAESFLPQRLKDQKTKKILSQLSSIDPLISLAAPEFPLDKIGKVDLAILRLAVFELNVEKKEPEKVIIDEAVELAKIYGGEGSPPFVNGVLGSILQNMTEPTLTEKLTTLLVERFGASKVDITPESELGKDLGLDNVEIADLISIIEKEWQIDFDGDKLLPEIKTFDDLVRIVEENSNEF
ncbi:hypothetical protein HYW54_01165 [Candidatus Gottesmanbacteria bacterium]|nr:hypothetical protein [Candidatus Gottesmanbacteria bacterium]